MIRGSDDSAKGALSFVHILKMSGGVGGGGSPPGVGGGGSPPHDVRRSEQRVVMIKEVVVQQRVR